MEIVYLFVFLHILRRVSPKKGFGVEPSLGCERQEAGWRSIVKMGPLTVVVARPQH